MQNRLNLGGRIWIVCQYRQNPAESLKGHLLDRRFGQQFLGLCDILVAHHVADIQGIRRDGPPNFGRVSIPLVKMFLDIFQVRLCFVDHAVRNFVALGLCQSESVGDVDR